MSNLEAWKAIQGYEGLYSVSNFGRIKSEVREIKDSVNRRRVFPEKILTPVIKHAGYLHVSLYKNGKIKIGRISRIVAKAFIPNPENKPQVNHLNGIKTDNRVENLEWCTDSENKIHSFKSNLRIAKNGERCNFSKLSDAQVREIKASGKQQSFLARKYGVSDGTISMIKNNKTWKHVSK